MAHQTRGADSTQRRATPAELRDLEIPAKLHDATVQLPEHIRTGMGYDTETMDDTKVVASIAETVRKHGAWSPEFHIVGAAIAVGMGHDETARQLLQRAPDAPDDVAKRFETLRSAVVELSRGRASNDLEALSEAVREVGGSAWLVARLAHRHHGLASDPSRAADSLRQAQQQATRWVELQLTHGLFFGGLVLIGFLALLSWPFLKRVVGPATLRRRAARTQPSFSASNLQRVVVIWFLTHLAIGMVLGGLIGADPEWFVVGLIVNSLLDGAMALFLIGRSRNGLMDPTPLAATLQLSPASPVGGRWMFPLWAFGGLAVCLFFTVAGSLLNIVVTGAGSETQGTVLILEQLTNGLDIALATFGVCVVAPVVEEVIFRGYVYSALRQMMGPVGAMVLSGLLFAVVHLDPMNLLPLAALGAGLAFVFEWSGSLWVPIVIHALFNLMTMLRIVTMAGL